MGFEMLAPDASVTREYFASYEAFLRTALAADLKEGRGPGSY
ncbi:MAG TPA: hypothetical protein VME42_08900 [Steroidobacteraceae bacterium]|nr:hypothetical protein [Steroidobacteraceae bacterium]